MEDTKEFRQRRLAGALRRAVKSTPEQEKLDRLKKEYDAAKAEIARRQNYVSSPTKRVVGSTILSESEIRGIERGKENFVNEAKHRLKLIEEEMKSLSEKKSKTIAPKQKNYLFG